MYDDIRFIVGFFSFWTGATIASFLNVVIWRVPRGESIVSPPSHCPKCGAAIRWWQNIPILSWLALRGKCASCRAPISPRYIFVEALGGALFLAAFLKYGGALAGVICGMHMSVGAALGIACLLVAWMWIALMMVGSFIDFDHQLLPDFVTVGGMVLGVCWALARTACGFLCEDFAGATAAARLMPLLMSLAGLVFGFGLLWLVRWAGSKAFGREAMGMGDVFLMGAVGALFGPESVLVTLVLSSIVGSVVGVGMILLAKTRLGRFTEIPFGPYLCMGCLAYMFWGEEICRWYVRLLGF